MTKILRISPEKKHSTEVTWRSGATTYKINVDFEFSDALVFIEKEIVVVFHFGRSDVDQFVGRVFDFQGTLLCDIPFPSLGCNNPQVHSYYSWSSEIDNGVKIVFGTNSISYTDFWSDFDFEKKNILLRMKQGELISESK